VKRPGGTEGYSEEADALVRQYESISFADVHSQVLHLIPADPSRILDIGSGTGRDAAALAAMGHQVTAVEPTAELRLKAQALHPSPRIEWTDDSLPDLSSLAHCDGGFDVVMLTAVWMHLDEHQRRRAMPNVAGLVRKRRCGDDVAAAQTGAAGTAHVRGLGRGNDSAGAAAGSRLCPAPGGGVVVAPARGHVDAAGLPEGTAPYRRRSISG